MNSSVCLRSSERQTSVACMYCKATQRWPYCRLYPPSVRHEARMQPPGLTQAVSKEVTLLMCPSNHASQCSHICLYKGTLKCASSVPIRTAVLCYGHWTEGLQPGRIHKLPRNYGRLQAGRPCFPKTLLSACVRPALPIMVYTSPWLFDQPPKER